MGGGRQRATTRHRKPGGKGGLLSEGNNLNCEADAFGLRVRKMLSNGMKKR